MGFSTSWNSSDSCQIYAMGNAQASLIENWLDICLFRCSTYFPNSEKNVTDVFPIKILSGKLLWFLLKLWIFASRILENITEHGWANHVTKRIHTYEMFIVETYWTDCLAVHTYQNVGWLAIIDLMHCLLRLKFIISFWGIHLRTPTYHNLKVNLFHCIFAGNKLVH